MMEVGATDGAASELPRGLRLVYSSGGKGSRIWGLAWSPDDRVMASGFEDGAVRLWDGSDGERIKSLKKHHRTIYCVAWSTDGTALASGSQDGYLRVWPMGLNERSRKVALGVGAIYSITWSRDGRMIAVGCADGTVRVLDARTLGVDRELHHQSPGAYSVSWSPNGRELAAGCFDGLVRLWDIGGTDRPRELFGHGAAVSSVAWLPDGRSLVSGSWDNTVRLWNLRAGAQQFVFEGANSSVHGVSVSRDGRFVAARSEDIRLRIWRCSDGTLLSKVSGRTTGSLGGVAFHPQFDRVAVVSGDGEHAEVYAYDATSWDAAPGAGTDRRYRNAKVVLVGDSGAGKTGLELALRREGWRATSSTHGRTVHTFGSEVARLSDGSYELRETLLWDLAGQPGYRIVHQLHLNEVAVALVVFDARNERDPLAGIKHWERALRLARKVEGAAACPVKRYLVAARADRGGVGLSESRIKAVVGELRFDGYFETSAKENWGIKELREAVERGIEWAALPQVVSEKAFHDVKDFLAEEKAGGRLIETADELFRSYCTRTKKKIDDQELRDLVRACVGRVENRGLIKRLTFGGYVLLQPELLDAYASAMVNAAKDEPDGLGFIAEEVALSGRFRMSEDERVEDKGLEKLLLIATVEEMLAHEIVLKEAGGGGMDLVFPSEFTRERPDAPEVPGREAVYTFEGPLMNVYATLAVRLAHSGVFAKKEMYRNAATYSSAGGGVCGLYLREIEEGKGDLTLFYQGAVGDVERRQFEGFVARHLEKRAITGTVALRRVVICGGCETAIADEQVKKRLARGKSTMDCPVCDREVSLVGYGEKVEASEQVAEMDRAADRRRDLEKNAMTVKGKEATEDFDVFLCHNSKDKRAVEEIGRRLKEEGLLPWLDDWNLRPGKSAQREMARQIRKAKAAAVFVGKGGMGPWQDLEQEAFIREFLKRDCPVIPVILPGCAETPEMPVFLGGMTWVDFRKGEPDPMKLLVWGITGERGLLG